MSLDTSGTDYSLGPHGVSRWLLSILTRRKRSFRAGIWKSLPDSVSVFFPILTGNTKTLISPFVLIGKWYDEQNCLSTVSFQIFISSN